ncbi:hypothetical protein ILYODFUR_038661 [Ilyodon furcidens]|uniref:Secreted protein n=1 Tax=Ilyodon furcidens TaxID=33524 RepID=A0ABV0UYQ9_9TELE
MCCTLLIVPSLGATLSQLSDSGQTLSEDSGVDIADAGGLSKDGSPRPSKNKQGHLEQQGAHVPPTGATRQVRPTYKACSRSYRSFCCHVPRFNALSIYSAERLGIKSQKLILAFRFLGTC